MKIIKPNNVSEMTHFMICRLIQEHNISYSSKYHLTYFITKEKILIKIYDDTNLFWTETLIHNEFLKLPVDDYIVDNSNYLIKWIHKSEIEKILITILSYLLKNEIISDEKLYDISGSSSH